MAGDLPERASIGGHREDVAVAGAERMKAIRVPSGDQVGQQSPGESFVSSIGSPPGRGILKMCWFPLRFESKTSQRPSGATSMPSLD
jgi:hypothetical protein